MNHPLPVIKREKRKAIFTFLLLFTLLVMLVLNVTGRPLITIPAPAGIISYELAGDVATAQKILESWDGAARTHAGFNLGLDFLFLVLYSSTIALAIIWLIDLLELERRAKRWAMLLPLGLILAAILDVIENTALVVMLLNEPISPWPQVAFICAVVKFSLVFLGLASVFFGVFTLLWLSAKENK